MGSTTEREHETLADRLQDEFRPITLAILSIVQGVALAELASVVAGSYHSFSIAQWILAATTFGTLIAVWHHFVTDGLFFVWIPDLLDAILPFATGALELFMCHALIIGMSAWLFASAALVGIGAMAYRYPEMHAANTALARAFISEVNGYRRFAEVYAIAGAVLFVVLGVLSLPRNVGMGSSAATGLAFVAFAWETGFFIRAYLYSRSVIAYAHRARLR